ncbi:MAG: alanine--tRNA ligase [Betaproteobacteria bacterium]|nr:alanine--tRNA ligase [Betaproteobacteria bacterium]
MKSREVRQKFIEFFKQKNHTFVPSSSTIPVGDKTILFTIAGMAQFKDALTGVEKRPYVRATNSQKCIRIGDLDDVGKDGRHCTMFEMLGSWSFGDYYKNNAISWAYELVKDVYKLPMDKLWVSVHDSDNEAAEIWNKTGMPKERIVRLGDKDNFWTMGPTGPCGPCTELYLDQGPELGKCDVKSFDCKAGPGCDCDRYLEFWNLVFMQYDKKEDGTLEELPFKSVDTGSGLERVTALLQGKPSAFEIDSFEGIRAAILKRAQIPEARTAHEKESLNVVCDHIRTLSFTLADGANFSAEGRGYVLRRVLRRAVRHAHRLNPSLPKSQSFLSDIVPAVVEEFGEFFPEVQQQQKRVQELIRNEEARFVATLESGLSKFQSFVNEARAQGRNMLMGEDVFVLHDTFGFPSDLTRVLCEESGMKADLEGFVRCMQAQKEKSRAEAKFYKFDQDDSPWVELNDLAQTALKTFAGYNFNAANARVGERAAYETQIPQKNIARVRQLKNKYFELWLAQTPFYPEGGGQVSDTGWVRAKLPDGSEAEFEVLDVRKSAAAIVHLLRHSEWSSEDAELLPQATLKQLFNAPITALVDMKSRAATMRNHTATHLLHKALQVVLGEGVRQAGSYVGPDGLRFDFSHPSGMTREQIARVEELVNEEILKNTAVKTHENVKLDDAKKMGAMAIFDEKYEDAVRVLEVPGFSMELCGGTHVPATGSIGLFRITSEGSVTSGVRRVEAVTGAGVLEILSGLKQNLGTAAELLKCSEADVLDKVRTLRDGLKETERQLATVQSRLANSVVEQLVSQAVPLAANVRMVAAQVDISNAQELELYADRIKEKGIEVVVVGAALEGKAMLLSAVKPDVTKTHKNLTAGNIIKQLSEKVDGKGGGRPDFARGGGSSPEKLPAALNAAGELVRAMV